MSDAAMIGGKGFVVCTQEWDSILGHALRSRAPVIHDMTLVSAIHPIGRCYGLYCRWYGRSVIDGTMIDEKGFVVCTRKWDSRWGHALRSRAPVIHVMTLVYAIYTLGRCYGL